MLNRAFPNICLEDLLIVLCIALVKDTAEATGLNLFKICDIAELVKDSNRIDWELLLKRAKKFGARGALFVGLRAADDLLGIPMPTDIRDMVCSNCAVETIARHTVAMVRDGPPAEKRFPHQTRIMVQVRERSKDKALVVFLAIGEKIFRKTRILLGQPYYS
jgi:hypothetical protein